MGERLLCKQEVIGSIPFTSTTWVVELPERKEVRGVALPALVRGYLDIVERKHKS